MDEFREFYQRHLPHWQPKGAVFFVTTRLKDSLPHEIIEMLRQERAQQKLAIQCLPESERAKQDYLDERRYFGKWDAYLDKAKFGPTWLSQPEIAEILKEALHFRDGKVYDLHAYSILSNHTHIVFEPIGGRSEWHSDPESDYQSDLLVSDYQSDLQIKPLQKIMQSLKRHTARKSNSILGREGAFWQDESYDHVIRDNWEYLRIIHYVLQNPVNASLASKREDWLWTYCKPDLL